MKIFGKKANAENTEGLVKYKVTYLASVYGGVLKQEIQYGLDEVSARMAALDHMPAGAVCVDVKSA